MCMHAQEVFFKYVTFFKNGHKKLFSLQNVMKRIVWNTLLFGKKLSASSKNGNPPIKNNGPSLRLSLALWYNIKTSGIPIKRWKLLYFILSYVNRSTATISLRPYSSVYWFHIYRHKNCMLTTKIIVWRLPWHFCALWILLFISRVHSKCSCTQLNSD